MLLAVIHDVHLIVYAVSCDVELVAVMALPGTAVPVQDVWLLCDFTVPGVENQDLPEPPQVVL